MCGKRVKYDISYTDHTIATWQYSREITLTTDGSYQHQQLQQSDKQVDPSDIRGPVPERPITRQWGPDHGRNLLERHV